VGCKPWTNFVMGCWWVNAYKHMNCACVPSIFPLLYLPLPWPSLPLAFVPFPPLPALSSLASPLASPFSPLPLPSLPLRSVPDLPFPLLALPGVPYCPFPPCLVFISPKGHQVLASATPEKHRVITCWPVQHQRSTGSASVGQCNTREAQGHQVLASATPEKHRASKCWPV
jgi:hypothetical protein